ncbi:RNA-binding domain-containing protein [Phascolarctobacterium sp.]|uniref:RNA-binding domain-containing protein n=1 Tax=Phascolarctobacterium sp. TaxID=2049039 RepID=UPI00386E6BD2
MLDSKQILDLLKHGEKINLECKKAESKLPKSVWETYSAFANTIGGVILFGVEENLREVDIDKKYTCVSIKNPSQRIKEFWDTINSAKVNVNILVDSNVGVCEINGTNIIYIEVPQANYKERPVYINDNINKGTYKRNYEGDYHCSEDEIKAMLRDASDSGNDGALLIGYTMDDIDLPTLKFYRTEFEHNHPGHVWNGIDDLDFIKNLGGYAIDRADGKGWLTTAGLLMFGKGLSIRERFDNVRMDFIDKSNLVPDSRWSDRLTYDGTWENNLYNFVRLALPKLVRDLKRPFKLQGMVRVDDTPVHKALREAVINMMIHSDYLITGILKIVKLEDGFEFYNPGSLKLPIKDIYEGGHSVARNPRIQTMFRMIGFGDNAGSGFPTILKVWDEEQWLRPKLKQNDELHQVELRMLMTARKKENGKTIVFNNDTDRLIYEYVCKNGQITIDLVGNITEVKSRQGATNALKRLIAMNLLYKVPSGKGRKFIYKLNV